MRIEIHSIAFDVDPQTDLAGPAEAQPGKLRFWERMAQGTWEPELIDRFCRSLRRPGVVVDVGAWIGPYSLLAAAAGRDVLSLEPDPDAFCKLLRNRSLLPLPEKVTPVAGALWPRREFVKLHALSLGDSETSVAHVRRRKEKTVTGAEFFYAAPIGFDQLDRLIGDRDVSLIKVDIEGAEYDNLPGILDFVARKRCDLQMAFHPQNLIGLDADLGLATAALRKLLAARDPGGPLIEVKLGREWLTGAALSSRSSAFDGLDALSVSWVH